MSGVKETKMSKPVYISSKSRGYAHPKCYLSHTNGCSTKITSEHYISHNLLNKIEQQNKTIDVAGLTWLPKGQLTSIGKKNLVSNILCDRHNSDLSPLDSAIGDLVDAIGSIDAEYQGASPVGRDYIIDGSHVERWVLKTVIGLVKSEQIKQRSGESFKLKRKCLELLCLPSALWPLGWGLYIDTPIGQIYHSSSFELLPQHNPETGELLVLGLRFNGIAMNFLMGKPDQQAAFGIRRPSQLIFEKGTVKSEISLTWSTRKTGAAITFTHTGVYSGPSPDHHLYPEK